MEKKGYREELEFLKELFPKNQKGCLNVKEAASYFDVSEQAIYDALNRKENPLPGKKMGGSWSISMRALAQWMC